MNSVSRKKSNGIKKTTARSYGHAHQQRRKVLEPAVAAGSVLCGPCGMLIVPGEAWDLDHRDAVS
jgi:hypothetical protein